MQLAVAWINSSTERHFLLVGLHAAPAQTYTYERMYEQLPDSTHQALTWCTKQAACEDIEQHHAAPKCLR